MDDIVDKWWRQKFEEQKEVYSSEIVALRKSLNEYKDAAIIAAAMKRKFVSVNGQYHNILKQYEKELELVFGALEDLLKE